MGKPVIRYAIGALIGIAVGGAIGYVGSCAGGG